MEYAHKHTRDTRESTTERGREIIIGDIEIEEAKKKKIKEEEEETNKYKCKITENGI